MLRSILRGAAIFAMFVAATALAADNQSTKNDKKKDKSKHHVQATITKVDAQDNEISVKLKDKDGSQQEKTLSLAKDAQFMDCCGKSDKLSDFHSGDHVFVTLKDNKVTQLAKHAMAKITNIDAKAGTLTVKMQDENGKTVDKKFHLIEDTEYLDDTGRIAVWDVFKSGDDVLVIESDGNIHAIKKANANDKSEAANGNNKKESSDKEK